MILSHMLTEVLTLF